MKNAYEILKDKKEQRKTFFQYSAQYQQQYNIKHIAFTTM